MPLSKIEQSAVNSNVAGTGPAFSATNSSNQTVTAGVSTKITLDSEAFDTNNNFASSRFTPTVAGYYQINAGVYCPSTSRILAIIVKNGTIFTYGTDLQTSTTEQRSRVSQLLYLNGSTDYVELYALPITGTTIGSLSENTFLSGAMVRAA